jgi:hypothetical protein
MSYGRLLREFGIQTDPDTGFAALSGDYLLRNKLAV